MGQRDSENRLRDWLTCRRPDLAEATWHALPNGRTNEVWRIDTSRGPVIGKLSLPDADTPMFPNTARHEIAALKALADWAPAPRLYSWHETPLGTFLELSALSGRTWARNATRVGALLSTLHSRHAPSDLRSLDLDTTTLVDTPETWLAGALPHHREVCLHHRPNSIPTGLNRRKVFLHGDPVPGNLLETDTELFLTDWQCPALGHPVFDLATFASPAMQVLAGNPPLPLTSIDDVLSAYGDAHVTDTFHAMRCALSWRMACYAAWRVGTGRRDYEAALAAELALLDDLK